MVAHVFDHSPSHPTYFTSWTCLHHNLLVLQPSFRLKPTKRGCWGPGRIFHIARVETGRVPCTKIQRLGGSLPRATPKQEDTEGQGGNCGVIPLHIHFFVAQCFLTGNMKKCIVHVYLKTDQALKTVHSSKIASSDLVFASFFYMIWFLSGVATSVNWRPTTSLKFMVEKGHPFSHVRIVRDFRINCLFFPIHLSTGLVQFCSKE